MSASTDKKLRAEAIKAGTYKKTIAAQEAAKKKSAENKKFAIGGAILAIIIILALVLNSGLMFSATTAAKVGGESFSPAQLNVYYGSAYQEFLSNYGSYASMFGLNTSYGLSGLGSQQSIMGGTWKEYFTDYALGNLQQVVAFANWGKANGVTLSDEDYANIDAQVNTMKLYADTYGYKSLNAFLAYNYGKGVTEKVFRTELERMALATAAAEAYDASLTYSDAELKEYYEGLNGQYDVVNYIVYTINADTDSDGAVSEEEASAANAQANAIADAYAEIEEGTPVEKLSAALEANGITADVTDSYSYVLNLNNVYAEWVSAQTEEAAGVVDNENGSYVVVFIGREGNDFNTASVRHILVKAEADENGVYTDEALAAAKARAEEILAEFKAGDMSEDSFIQLVALYSEDPGAADNQGLYTVTDRHTYVEEFTDFALAKHSVGDTAIVYGQSASYAGYHVMFYSESGMLASNYIADNLMRDEAFSAWSSEQIAAYPADTAFFSRYIGLVS